jgi:hypothetical protein
MVHLQKIPRRPTPSAKAPAHWRRSQAADRRPKGDAQGMARLHDAKIKPARYLMQKMIPEIDGRFKSLTSGSKTLMEMAVERL